jgi:hypothetical protein
VLADETVAFQNLAKAITRRFKPLGGIELLLPARGPMRKPPKPKKHEPR